MRQMHGQGRIQGRRSLHKSFLEVGTISSLVITIILLSVLVVAHEFGHFIVAKKSGIWVQEFAIGMGPKLLSHTKGKTEYSLRLLPLGGFCRMEGGAEDGASSPTSFLSKSVGTRFAVMAAGPLMNFVLAFIMIFGLTCTTYTAIPVIGTVLSDSAAEEAGLMIGDTIQKINGKTIHIYDELQYILQSNQGERLTLDILGADGTHRKYELQPKLDAEQGRYLIGFTPEIKTGLFAKAVEGHEEMGIGETAYHSFFAMINYVKMTAAGLLRIFTFTAGPEEYGGPIAIFDMVGKGYEAGLQYSLMAAMQNVVYIGAVLSENLGVLNLFPIPALDGGKILFLLIEAVRRKPMDMETEAKFQFAGFLFLMGLMVLILVKDITKYII